MRIVTNISLDPDIMAELDKQADEVRLNRSAYIAHMVRGRMKLPKDNKEN